MMSTIRFEEDIRLTSSSVIRPKNTFIEFRNASAQHLQHAHGGRPTHRHVLVKAMDMGANNTTR